MKQILLAALLFTLALSTKAQSSSVTLGWNATTNDANGNIITVSGYNIYEVTSSVGAVTLLGNTTNTTFTIPIVDRTINHTYTVTCTLGNFESARANPVVLISISIPASPTNLHIVTP